MSGSTHSTYSVNEDEAEDSPISPQAPPSTPGKSKLGERRSLPNEKIVSEIPGMVLLTNYRLLRTNLKVNNWRLWFLPSHHLEVDVWLKDIVGVNLCKTPFPTTLLIICIILLGLSIAGVTYGEIDIGGDVEVGLQIAQFGIYLIAVFLVIAGYLCRVPCLAVHVRGLSDCTGGCKLMIPLHPDFNDMMVPLVNTIRKLQHTHAMRLPTAHNRVVPPAEFRMARRHPYFKAWEQDPRGRTVEEAWIEQVEQSCLITTIEGEEFHEAEDQASEMSAMFEDFQSADEASDDEFDTYVS